MCCLDLKVGARSSPLSKIQAQEVLSELQVHHPGISFSPVWVQTTGDHDQTTSLRHLEKSDFFTRELDLMLQQSQIRISIHSAKDLPEPLADTLSVVALTKGVDPRDVLVISPKGLPERPVIATSSLRRKEEIEKRFPNAVTVDIRGTIEARLSQLDSGQIDGVVMAQAALIRLSIHNRPVIELEGFAALQGRLVVLARKEDVEMASLFSCIDARPCMLYTGLDAPTSLEKRILHVPLIQTTALNTPLPDLEAFTHFIFTSKTAVRIMCERADIRHKPILSVGKKTTLELERYGCKTIFTAANECQEGIMDEISKLSHPNPNFFWPHSRLSRPNLQQFLEQKKLRHTTHILYDTTPRPPEVPIDLSKIDEIFFSSPSTIDAYISLFGPINPSKRIYCQAAITEAYLKTHLTHQGRKSNESYWI